MSPVQIKILNKNELLIKWDDKSESKISLKYLRDECPCAVCKGETILLKTYRPAKPRVESVGMYEIKNIETVGDYAILVSWKDGHNTGIYSWEYLLELGKSQGKDKNQNYERLI